MKHIGFILLICLINAAMGQQETLKRSPELDAITESFKTIQEARNERVKEFLRKNPSSVLQSNSENTILLYDVINSNHPVYIKTDNLGAAITTGADHLVASGDLGLTLDGTGVGLAIWDGGRVRVSHQEFGNRIQPSDGAASDNFHATHVAGTILAAGVNASAKGMATAARARTFDFNNDDSEMSTWVSTDHSGIILSNHSYGTITGWYNGSWFGDTNISTQEDYLFGFYTGGAQGWDQLAHEAEYYTIVKSAGNDRGDSGSGPHPPDGPYDIIATNGTAKNIFTIGAVGKVNSYTGPSSVVMSSFSGWGPTDDGRIKPDFVAAGVGLFSTFETSDDDYGSLNGTSMSAPNATGTFALLQELHMNLYGGIPMKSAELKALVAHTALEAGIADGPDYKFGWGLIDAKSAAQYLIQENTTNKLRIPIVIENGGNYNFSFTPTNGTKVTATLCWNDVPGTPPSAQLDPTNLMLVNDLDMLIVDGSSHFPWILNPAAPGTAATRGDNFRDNIEKIEFVSDGTETTLTINHKNSITGGSQEAFLVLSFETASAPKTFYWTGSNGSNISDNLNWSDASGGASTGISPSSADFVVIDNNSFQSQSGTIQLSQNTTLSSILSFQDQEIILDLNGFDLIINGNATFRNMNFTGEGNVIFGGESGDDNKLNLSTSLANVSTIFQGEGVTWTVQSDCELGDVEVASGNLHMQSINSTIQSFEALGNGLTNIDFSESELTITNELLLPVSVNSVTDQGTLIDTKSNNVSIVTDFNLSSQLVTEGGSVSISGIGGVSSADISGVLNVLSDFKTDVLSLNEGAALIMGDNSSLTIEQFTVNSSNESRVSISSATSAQILIEDRQKICFDFLDISNVNFTGNAVANAGASGTVVNSTGWQQVECDQVLYSDFSFNYACENSIVYFENLSSGNIQSIEWDFGDGNSSTDDIAQHSYSSSGPFNVVLSISDGEIEDEFSLAIILSENTIPDNNTIIENSSGLVSLKSGISYQWFRNDILIEGATERIYNHNKMDGIYQVAIFDEDCNILSAPFEILTVLSIKDNSSILYPNPANQNLTIGVNSDENIQSVYLISLAGKQIPITWEQTNREILLNVSNLKQGVYIVQVRSKSEIKQYKFSKI